MKQAELHWQQNQPFNTQFNDIYFSREGGMAETEYVFLSQNDLPARWQGLSRFVIAETGFGTGLNFLTTARHWLQSSDEKASLHYFSVEKYPLNKADLKRALSCWTELDDLRVELLENYPPAVDGFHHIPLVRHRIVLNLMIGEVETMLSQMTASVDAWYLDGFAPDKNPEMWTENVFQQIKRLSKKGTTFSTFTSVGRVRRALSAVGFEVEKKKGFAGKREMCRGKLFQDPDPFSGLPWFAFSPSEHHKKHAIIVGAGIAGVTTAWALARRGWQIDLVEQHEAIAREGSGNPLGILMPRVSLKESAESAFYRSAYVKAIRELSHVKKAAHDFSWQQSGVLQLAISQRILKQIKQLSCDDDFVQGVSVERASEIAGVPINEKALYFPLAGWLNPGDLCDRLAKSSEGRIKLHFNTTITRLCSKDGLWQLFVQDDQLRFKSEIVVLANATHAIKFKETNWLPLEPARGQISIRPATDTSTDIRCVICYEGYILPAVSGTHVIGATFTRGDRGTELRAEDDAENLKQLERRLPEFFDFDALEGHEINDNETQFKGRAAIRAVTPDRMPMVGPVADFDYFRTHYHNLHKGKSEETYPKAQYLKGLYLNVGHGTKGLCSSFLSAELIASQINNEPSPVSKTVQNALNPSRFIIRLLRKRKFSISHVF